MMAPRGADGAIYLGKERPKGEQMFGQGCGLYSRRSRLWHYLYRECFHAIGSRDMNHR